MGIQRKHIILLILGQTACVAVGLWVHESLLVAMARDDAPSEALGWLTSHLATVGGVALLWTAGLLAVVLYLTLARFCGQQETGREKAAADTLRQAERLVRTRDAVIFGLAKLADSRDPETGDHLERICEYSAALAGAMRHHPRFRDQISANFVKLIGISAALHDIGKVGVEDRILRKPGPLTKAERVQMQTHTTIGAECLAQIERRLGSTNFLQMARQIALAHHERWDGAGYPEGLAGEAIPLAARIVAVADVYDALASRRVYKEPIIHETCIEIVRAGAGSQFDPDIIAVLLQIEWKFNEIVRHFKEPPLEADETSPVTTSEGPEPIEDEFLADVQTEIE